MRCLYHRSHKDAITPTRAYGGEDAGWDLYSCEEIELKPNQVAVKIPIGLMISLDKGFWFEITARSSSKLYVHRAIIDNGYRGEIFAVVSNNNSKPYTVKKGDRVAQMIIHKIIPAVWYEVSIDKLPESVRGGNGFGSSGI